MSKNSKNRLLRGCLAIAFGMVLGFAPEAMAGALWDGNEEIKIVDVPSSETVTSTTATAAAKAKTVSVAGTGATLKIDENATTIQHWVSVGGNGSVLIGSDPQAGGTANVIISGEDTAHNNGDVDGPGVALLVADASNAASLKVEKSSSLTIAAGGAKIGANGTVTLATAAELDVTGGLTIDGGTLTSTVGGADDSVSIDADILTVISGTVELQGNGADPDLHAVNLTADALDIQGGAVTMKANTFLEVKNAAGDAATISGGKLDIKATAGLDVKGGLDMSEDGVMDIAADSTIAGKLALAGGDGKSNAVKVDAATLTVGDLDVSKGTVLVDGNVGKLIVNGTAGDVNVSDGGVIEIAGGANAAEFNAKGALAITDDGKVIVGKTAGTDEAKGMAGSISVADTGEFTVGDKATFGVGVNNLTNITGAGAITQSGGTINILGEVDDAKADSTSAKTTLTQTDGALNIGEGTLSSQSSLILGGVATISGGTTTLDGNSATPVNIKDRAATLSAGSIVINGAAPVAPAVRATGPVITLANNSLLATEEGGDITINGGTINMTSATATKEAIIMAGSDDDTRANATYGKLTMNDGKIEVAKGVILSRDTEFNGGEIEVTDNLLVAGYADLGTANITAGLAGATQQWADFKFAGGTMTATGGTVDFITGNVTVTASAGEIDGDLYIAAAAGNNSGVYANSLTVTDDEFTVTGDLTITDGGSNNITIKDNGTLIIDGETTFAGTITAGTLDLQATGTLVASNLLQTGSGYFDYTVDPDGELTLGNGTAAAKTVLAGSEGNLVLKISTTANTYKMKQSDIDEWVDTEFALGDNSSFILYGVYTGDDIITDGTGQVSDESLTNNQGLAGDHTIDISAGLNGDDNIEFTDSVVNSGGINIVAENDPSKLDDLNGIQVNGNLNLTGINGPDSSIVTVDGEDVDIDVIAQGNVNLGVIDFGEGPQGGSLGNVTLQTSAANAIANDGKTDFLVNTGDFTAGSIVYDDTFTDAVDTTVSVTGKGTSLTVLGDGAALNSKSIDLSAVAVANKTAVDVTAGANLEVKGDGGIQLNGNANSVVSVDGANSTLVVEKSIDAPNVAVSGQGSIEAGSINATNVKADNGTIDAGNILAANVQVDSGEIDAENMGGVYNISIAGGSVDVEDTLTFGAGNAASVSIAGKQGTSGFGILQTGSLQLSADGGVIEVGTGKFDASKGGQGYLVADTVDLNGGAIYADPAWRGTGTNVIEDASGIFIKDFTTPGVQNGTIIVGQNSFFAYGYDGEADDAMKWMSKNVNETGVWGDDITAAVGLFKPLTIDTTSALIVDGSLADRDNVIGASGIVDTNGKLNIGTGYNGSSAYFAEDSLLLVNAKNLKADGTQAALTSGAGGDLDVEIGAKLQLVDAVDGGTYLISDNFNVTSDGTIGEDAWASTGGLFSYTVDEVGGNVVVEAKRNDARDVYDKISTGAAETVDWVFTNGSDVGDTGGYGFISRAVQLGGMNAPKIIEGAAQISALGGSQLTAFNIMRLNHNAIAQRFSFSSNPFGSYSDSCDTAFINDSVLGNGFAIWAGPVYQHARVSGMEVGPFDHDYKSNLGGANVGFDFTRGDNVRFGIMGSIGGGKNKSNGGEFAYTENKFDYYSISAFAGWSMNNISLLLDGGFTRVKSKIDQRSLDALHTEPKVHAWDVGLTAEYMIDAGFASVIPHAGIRYEGINTREHDIYNRSQNDRMMKVEKETQHLLSIPVGVSFAKHIQICNWRISPFADVGALFTVGDRDYESDVRLTGGRFDDPANTLSAIRSGYKTKMVDSVAFDGSAGLNVDNGRFFGGLNYNITAGKKQTVHGFMMNVGLNF